MSEQQTPGAASPLTPGDQLASARAPDDQHRRQVSRLAFMAPDLQQMIFEARAEGRTVFLSSHVLSEVESTCDRVAIIRDGRLARIGGVAELKDIRHHDLELTFAAMPALDAFRGLPGLERLDAAPDGVTLRIIVQGDIDPLIKLAAQYRVVNIVSQEPSLEEIFLRYYRARVQVLYDDRSALLRLRVQGFDPAYAQQLNKAILDESERFVNESSHQVARERLRFAEGELTLASQRLLKARNDLLAFQNKNKLLDPTLQAQAAGVLTAELEGSRSRLRPRTATEP